MFHRFGVSEVNTGNIGGVMWYLMNEIVTLYTSKPRCPRRFNISRIHRVKVKVRPPRELATLGMDFGARFAYDQGKCEGRCFAGNLCTGEGDCAAQYSKYGFFVGCNRFTDHYPFPNLDTSAAGGVWYSLPSGGRCAGEPTGQHDCTWSFEDAGEVTLQELESTSPGNDNCCEGRCSNFWHDVLDPNATSNRIAKTEQIFQAKYPNMPVDLPEPTCNFDHRKLYGEDPWHRQDPWHG